MGYVPFPGSAVGDNFFYSYLNLEYLALIEGSIKLSLGLIIYPEIGRAHQKQASLIEIDLYLLESLFYTIM